MPPQLMVGEISICDIRVHGLAARQKINFEVPTKLPRIDDYRDSSSYFVMRYNISREHASRWAEFAARSRARNSVSC